MFELFTTMNQQDLKSSYDQLKDFIYLRQEDLFEQGEKIRAGISTVEELLDYNRKMREYFIEGIGGLIETDTPLNAKVMRKREEKTFVLESIIYESLPGIFVTASMYIPKGISLPAPAVLFLCGHELKGRMSSAYRRVCEILVNAGLIIFAIDPIGQGERSNYYDVIKKEYLVSRAVSDHDACGIPAVATGKFLQRFFLNDQMRAVDYMITRPEIDPERIGITGQSGGGMETLVMMTCEDRLAAAAPVTFVTTRREFMYTGKWQDAEQIWPGITKFGFDHVNPFMIFAPKPTAILAVSSDFFPIEGTVQTYEEAKAFYGLYGKRENIRMYEDDYVHAYTTKLAVQAAAFFTEIFYGERRTVPVQDLELLALPVQYATESGNVLGEISGAQRIPDKVHEIAVLQREARMKISETVRKERAREWLKEKVYHDRKPVSFRPRIRPAVQEMVCMEAGYMGRPIGWCTQHRLFAYAVLITCVENGDKKDLPTVIAIWPDGTKNIAKHEAWIRQQCDGGKQVLVLDVPGVGNIKQQILFGDQRNEPYQSKSNVLSKLGRELIFCGDSMAAMHCYDVLRTIEMVRTCFGVKEEDITLYCAGNDGVYGVVAGFLNENVKREYGEDILWNVEQQILGQEIFEYEDTLSVIIPGMLEYFDYEELK